MVRGRSIHLKRGKYYQWSKLERGMNMRVKIWVALQKYLCFAKTNSTNIKNSTIILFNSLIVLKKLKIMVQF